ncbi:MAG: phosphate ABC transporter permease PstA [Candidatus Phosphoribacter sp.]|nr:phosphate ABC transporter permease PstA [Actinomycetales bacterium]
MSVDTRATIDPPDALEGGTEATPAVTLRAASHGDRNFTSMGFLVLLWLSLAFGIVVLAVLLVDTFIDGLPRLDSRMLTSYTSQVFPDRAGARAPILGSAFVITVTAAMAVPIGVGAAVYLEEFASKTSAFARMVELNVQNLAAVPAIIYGMLTAGLVVTVGIRRNSILSGAIALALLILPVVIVTTREALRAVPTEIRQGSLALGATQMQTVARQTLPAAIPGIATGVILSLSRAIGEAAPLLLLGGLVFVQYDPNGLLSGFSTLPIQIYDWSSRPQVAFQTAASAAIIILLVLLMAMNAVAIVIRNRSQRRW